MGFFRYKTSFDLDSSERTIFHRQIILNKPFLKRLYSEWYKVFCDAIHGLPKGKLVELGSGGGFFKDMEPSVICSDVLPLPTNDMTFSALNMPFENNEVSGIFMIDTFHHIPDAEKFIKEADRILKKEGEIIMIEPANSFLGRIIYQNLHHEPFNRKGDWKIPDAGPLSGANVALPWIVFERDVKLFMDKFPNFTITEIKYHTPLRYLISGGVSFKQIVPNMSFPFFTWLDRMLSSISKGFSMFVTIKIKKNY